MKLDEFTTAYIECALWSSHDNSEPNGGRPLDDNYGPEDRSLVPDDFRTLCLIRARID